MTTTVTMKQLFEAGAHFGHSTRYWQPKMSPYIYGSRNNIHIVNLEKTLPLMNGALRHAARIASKGGKVLFVGTKSAAQDIVKEQAERCGMPYVDHRWLGGMLTNFKTVRRSTKTLLNLRKARDNGDFERLIKKEALMKTRELEKLERALGGICEMKSLPDAIFVVDVHFEKVAVAEANKLRIPVIGVVDTNSSPDNIDFIIPGNDDAQRAVQLYASKMADAIIEAQAEAQMKAAQPVALEAFTGGEDAEQQAPAADADEAPQDAADKS